MIIFCQVFITWCDKHVFRVSLTPCWYKNSFRFPSKNLAKKNRTLEQLYEVMKELRSIIQVASTGAAAIDWALQQGFHDFEDAVQYYAALHCGAEYIITRNERDYPYSEIPVISPLEFLKINNVE